MCVAIELYVYRLCFAGSKYTDVAGRYQTWSAEIQMIPDVSGGNRGRLLQVYRGVLFQSGVRVLSERCCVVSSLLSPLYFERCCMQKSHLEENERQFTNSG